MARARAMQEAKEKDMIAFDTDSGLFELAEFGGKPITIHREKLNTSSGFGRPMVLEAGDSANIRATLYQEKELLYDKTLKFTVDCPTVIDTVAFFTLECELGFKSAVCVAFGESE